jgi:quercetin dioxygenase-like cupin family protein
VRLRNEEDTMRNLPILWAALLGAASLWPAVSPGDERPRAHMKGAAIFPAASIKWKAGPPSLPKGAMVAVLEGDPQKKGPFVLRLKFPDGYRVPPHTHPQTERVTVISGTLYIGMGETFDKEKGKAMPAGTFGRWPAGMKHFGWAKGETVIQLHGTGPWSIKYVNPEDDPRKKK